MAGILRRLKLSRNEITNDEIKTKVTTKEYEEGYDRIFKKKPQSLDAAYERRAMMQGLVTNPLFDENKERIPEGVQLIIGVDHSKDGDTTVYGYYDPATGEYHIQEVIETTWPESEDRMNVIGQNGPTGEHYFNVTDCEVKEFKENKD
jgi:hypothetical protein